MKVIRRTLPLALVALALVVPASSATSGAAITANQVVQGTITLDGALTEAGWSHGGAGLPFSLSKVVSGTWNNSVRYSTLWSATHLYIGIRVTDAARRNDSGNVWDDDSVEVYVDGDHNHGTTNDAADEQVVKGWNDSGVLTRTGDTGDVLHGWRSVSGGYEIEIAVPWAGLGVAPAVGTTVGFDIANNDDDNGGARDGQAVAFGSDRNWTDTSAFGDLLLTGRVASAITADQVAPATITVDGSLTEATWRHGRQELPYWLTRIVTGTSNNAVRYSALWSTDYLYLGARVSDAALRNDSAARWEDDSVEFFIDGDHNRGTSYDSHDNQYTKSWNDPGLSVRDLNTSGVLHGWKPVPGGYEVELAIPWANLAQTPAIGKTIGFDIANDDDDLGGTREGQTVAFGTSRNAQDTSAFGDLVLQGAPSYQVAPGIIAVDGAISEGAWTHGQADLPYGIAKIVSGAWNNTATYSTLWSTGHLYVGVRVTDASLRNDSGNVWDDDSVEVYVDGDHNHATTYDAADEQVFKGWNDPGVLTKSGDTTGIAHAWRTVTGGYEVELAIPWAALGRTPSPGETIGFSVGVNDDDNGGARDAQAMAFGTSLNWTDTSRFGHLTLAPARPVDPKPVGYGQAGGPSGGWTLTFADEFNGSTLDLDNWAIGYGWGNTTGHSIETVDAAHTYVEGGNLVLKVEKIGGAFYAGGVNTKNAAQPFGQTLGFFEVRYRAARPMGLISAAWGKRMVGAGQDEVWPPEVDIAETFDRVCNDGDTVRQNRALTSVHWGTKADHRLSNRKWCHPDNGATNNDFADDFHVYAVEWKTDAIIMYVDGVERARITSADGVDWAQLNDSPFYWIINLHVCGYGSTACDDPSNVYPAYMYADYVRFWRR